MIPLFDILKECVACYQKALHDVACSNRPDLPREALLVPCEEYIVNSPETAIDENECLMVSTISNPYQVQIETELGPLLQKEDLMGTFDGFVSNHARYFRSEGHQRCMDPYLRIESAKLTYVKGKYLTIEFQVQRSKSQYESDTSAEEDNKEEQRSILKRLVDAFPEYEIRGLEVLMGSSPNPQRPLLLNVQMAKPQPEYFLKSKIDKALWYRFQEKPCIEDAISLLRHYQLRAASFTKDDREEFLHVQWSVKNIQRVFEDQIRPHIPAEMRPSFYETVQRVHHALESNGIMVKIK